MNSRSVFASLLLAVTGLAFASTPALAGDKVWKPVDPAELALKTPVVDKDADAEAIFWEVRVAHEESGGDLRAVLEHYVRIKIFTERGKESEGKVEIAYDSRDKISDIAARTIKPDGTIVELQKDQIFERTLAKVGKRKLNAKTFAMPGVEPGAIVEYRYREVRHDITAHTRLNFQREIPCQLVKYYIKPLEIPGEGMRSKVFHGDSTPFVKESGGFYSTSIANVPALREEPRMPPEDQVRAWMLLFYKDDKKESPEQFWGDLGKRLYDAVKSEVKVNDEIKKAAATAVGDASTEDEKLHRIYDFVRSHVKNVHDDAAGMSEAEVAKVKENKSPADTLKRGTGTGQDVDFLFAALVTAAGFDARFAMSGDRSDIFFDPNFPDPYFLDTTAVAVKTADGWRFFSPGDTYVQFGMLMWQQEGQQALVTDSKSGFFAGTPMSEPAASLRKRTGKLTLAEDGTLEGDVKIEYTGHFAAELKEAHDEESAAERETWVREEVKKQMSTAELTNLAIENVTDPVKPLVVSYHVKVAGYAQRTGKRLFVQPCFFQHGVGPLFPTAERKNAVYFHYPWSEDDDVTIDLPAGYELDHADQPQGVSAAPVGQYEVKIGVTENNRALVYRRKLTFGNKGMIMFPVTSYAPLKQVFDVINERDNHTITLKAAAAAK